MKIVTGSMPGPRNGFRTPVPQQLVDDPEEYAPSSHVVLDMIELLTARWNQSPVPPGP